jgi:CRP/FNR family transcriptional regulator, cyclic AMP receptor protein
VIRDSYLRHLASVPLFSNCTKSQLQEIGKVADELILPVGKLLACQGEVGFEMFILVEGAAAVTRDGEHVATVAAGDVVGELAVLSGHPRNATVVAETELRVLVLTQRGLNQLLDDIPGLAKHMLYEVTARIVEGSRRSQELAVLVDVNLGFLHFHDRQ